MMRFLSSLFALCVISMAYADVLKHDPFARPLLTQPTVNSTLATSNNTSGETAIEIEVQWNPKLSAVMVAGKNSLVNIDGKIIRMGEETDGYRLVKVKDSEATFSRGSKRIILHIETQVPKESKDRGRL